MGFEQILFWLLALGVIVTSALVVLPPGGKNPLYGALLLIVSFFFMSGLYVLLFAHTMAVLQILVYAGAIMVLFTFVIMLLNLSKKEIGDETRTIAKGVGVVAVVALAVKTALVIETQTLNIPAKPLPAGFGGVDAIADTLFHNYLVPFELTGVLLLVAVIGAVVLAKRTL
jgi:NADH-quinone oxidoreductase subunit J